LLTVNGSPTYADKNAGRAKPVTVSRITVECPDAGNYAYKDLASAEADITPRGLNVQLTARNKVYDGTTAATVTSSGDDRVPGDLVTVSCVGGGFTFDDKNVGTGKPVRPGPSIRAHSRAPMPPTMCSSRPPPCP
jgi:hypothetical protein